MTLRLRYILWSQLIQKTWEMLFWAGYFEKEVGCFACMHGVLYHYATEV